MFEVVTRKSYKNIPIWYKEIKKHADVPVTLIANKVDCQQRKLKREHIMFHRTRNIMYYDVSVKANYQIEKPFLYLMRKLMNEVSLTFNTDPIVQAPDMILEPEFVAALEQEGMMANLLPLPDPDDDEL